VTGQQTVAEREHPVPCRNLRAHDPRHPAKTWHPSALCEPCLTEQKETN